MRTIKNGNKNIMRIWKISNINVNMEYRLMKYVLVAEENGKVGLNNNVTGEFVILDENDISLVQNLPSVYHPSMNSLIEKHFLVPVDYDEHNMVVSLRKIIKRLQVNRLSEGIYNYTILPTTGCNARCYYCYEAGIKVETMTERTAEDVVNYIVLNCGEKKKVNLTWFGGEPTIASKRINQICEGLKRHNIEYNSFMYSNGYLLDEKLVPYAKNLWNLTCVQIVVDATGDAYDRIKNYVNVKGNSYSKVMDNIDLLLKEGIPVTIRTNIDIGNYEEFKKLVNDISNRFTGLLKPIMYAYPIVGEYPYQDGYIEHADDSWMEKTIIELNDLVREKGLAKNEAKELPILSCDGCMGDSDSAIVIGPSGNLYKCLEQLGENEIVGNVNIGITNTQLCKSWKMVADYKMCKDCIYFPSCVKLANCTSKEKCYRIQKKNSYKRIANKIISDYNNGEV